MGDGAQLTKDECKALRDVIIQRLGGPEAIKMAAREGSIKDLGSALAKLGIGANG